MKTFRSFRKQLEEKVDPSILQRVGNAIKSVGGKSNPIAPPLTSQQKKIMDGIKNILAKDSSEMNIRKANMTIDKYSRANPQVDDKAIAYMRKMISSYA